MDPLLQLRVDLPMWDLHKRNNLFLQPNRSQDRLHRVTIKFNPKVPEIHNFQNKIV